MLPNRPVAACQSSARTRREDDPIRPQLLPETDPVIRRANLREAPAGVPVVIRKKSRRGLELVFVVETAKNRPDNDMLSAVNLVAHRRHRDVR